MDKSFGDEPTLGPAPKSGGHTYALKEGDLFGQYRVIRVLGAGGMGEVYEVEHTTLERRYALKLLPSTLDWQGVSVERFRREAKVMANLDHPNILKVDEFGEVNGRYWLRMEIAEGIPEVGSRKSEVGDRRAVSLQDLAEAYGGKVPQEELLPILRQVLEGLQYAHNHGAIHRDLKPSNILLSEAGGSRVEAGGHRPSSLDPSSSPDPRPSTLAKISDFGLVRLVGEDWVRSQAQISVQRSLSMGDERTAGGKPGSSEGSSTRALLGTYEYMSPEQKRGEEADERSDLYSVGLMAYRLLTGRSLLTKMPSRMGFADDWDDFIEAALEEDASDRMESAVAMLAQLRRLGTDGPRNAESQLGTRPASPSVEIKESKPPPVPEPEENILPGTERSIDLGGAAELKLCWIPATTSAAWKEVGGGKDTFTMGSPYNESGRYGDEGPRHEVTISRGFWMGKYPVTQRQYQQLMGENPSYFKNAGLDAPVERVTWYDAMEFSDKLQSRLRGDLQGKRAGLPTEAEWEYACRAGRTTALYNGKELTSTTGRCQNLDEIAWYVKNSGFRFFFFGGITRPVGEKQANAWGLHDILGNVWEWCRDGERTYSASAVTDPGINDTSGSSRVLRGGSWNSSARFCRSADRDNHVPGGRSSGYGFRVLVC